MTISKLMNTTVNPNVSTIQPESKKSAESTLVGSLKGSENTQMQYPPRKVKVRPKLSEALFKQPKQSDISESFKENNEGYFKIPSLNVKIKPSIFDVFPGLKK